MYLSQIQELFNLDYFFKNVCMANISGIQKEFWLVKQTNK